MLGQEYTVKSWREVLEKTLNIIADTEPDSFQEIVEQFPRFLSWDSQKFHENRQLKNGAFVEVNLSAKDIYAFCLKVMETAAISPEEWEVETNN